MPYKKNVIEVKVPNYSGADMSHRNSGSLSCGTLQPILVEEVIPGARCHLKVNEVVQLPPLASDTYADVKLKHEAFFVPLRILCKSAEDWFADTQHLVSHSTGATVSQAKGNVTPALPVLELPLGISTSFIGAGSLLDYLGFKVNTTSGKVLINPLSLIAYHLIWQEFYRNPRVQLPCFVDDLGTIQAVSFTNSSQRMSNVRNIYYHYESNIGGTTVLDNHIVPYSTSSCLLADNVNLLSFRQRNFGLDFFTGARPSPQQGAASAVSFNIPLPDPSSYDPSDPTTTNATGGYTVQQLRVANSIQLFRERNNLPSSRMVDQVKARYNVNLADGVAQRPICLGSASYDVITRGVDQTAGDSTTTTNPFNSVANQYGRAYAVCNDNSIIDYFEAKEPGFIMVLQSLVPEVTYSSGVSPYLFRYREKGSIVEMANPLLQNIGDEPIDASMLTDDPYLSQGNIFGYQDRFGTFMHHSNEVHGLLRDGNSLSSFVLQRSFSSVPSLGSSFLEIPTNYLDGIFAVASGISGLSAWYDAKLEWKISLPLAEFSIPSLQDPAYEHGQTVYLRRNGQIF